MGNSEEREEMLEVNNVRLSVKEAGSGPDMILRADSFQRGYGSAV